MRKKRIKFLPGIASAIYICEIIIYSILLIPFYLISEVQNLLWLMTIVVLAALLLWRIIFFVNANGFEIYIKVKNNKIFSCTIPFKSREYLLNDELCIYKTKVSSQFGAGCFPSIIVDLQNGEENAFIIIFNENFVDDNLVKKLHRNIETMNMQEKVKYSGNLMKNKNIILLRGNKSNYNFLRQYLTKEQFCGLTENDNKDLEKYEEIYQRKLSKIKK